MGCHGGVEAGGHAFLASAVKICEFMPNAKKHFELRLAAAAITAARHGKVPWLKLSKELHMLSHCLRMC